MGVYVGYILKTKLLFFKYDVQIRLKQLLLVIIIIFKMYHSLTLKFIIGLKLNNNFVEQGQLHRGEV